MEDNSKLKEEIKLKIAISKLDEEENKIAMEKSKKIVVSKGIIAASVCLILSTGVVFAKDIQQFCENFILKKNTVSNTPSDVDYTFYKDMQQEHGIYYKKIDSFKEYLKYKNMWSDLLDMSEEEFENNFMIITAAENSDTINLEISEIYNDDKNIYIEFYETNNNYNSSIIIGTKLSRECERENIKIRYKKDIAITDDKYIKITNIPNNYSVEEAIKDGCFVVDNNKIISNNKEVMSEFLEKCNNGIECNIRIYGVLPQGKMIKDIQFINNKYKVNILNLNDITDLYSKEYIYLKNYSFSIGENKYISIDVTNDTNRVYWDPFLIYID